MSDHAKYGGSTIKRTFECPGWAGLCATLPPQKSSEFADRGTLLHLAMENIYTADADFDPRRVIGFEENEIVLTAELYDEKIVPAMAAVEEIFDKYDVQDFVCEARVTISDLAWGTADLLAKGEYRIYDEGEDQSDPKAGEPCTVGICLDYKFGDGIPVSAIENDQLLFYATAAAITPETEDLFQDIDILVLVIVQPNERGEPDYTLCPVDPKVLAETRQKILAAVDYAESPSADADFASGDHCTFCTGRGLCPVTSGEIAAMARLDVTAPDLMKNGPTFAQAKLAQKNIKAYLAFVHSQLEEGVDWAGFKLVPKRAARVYTDEAAVREIIRRSKKIKRVEAYTDTLFTPPQLEKMCKAKELDFNVLFGEHVDKVSSGTTLADESDKRESAPNMAALKSMLERD